MRNFLLILCMAFLPMHIMANTQDTIIGRQLKSFDLSAFCSYNSFHPSDYLTDNNWDILCAFVQSGSAAKLDSLGIPYNRSQLRLLEVGDLCAITSIILQKCTFSGKVRHNKSADSQKSLPTAFSRQLSPKSDG